MDYGRAIRIVRTARGWSQAKLADRLSVGTSHVSLLEAGKRQPSVQLLAELATALIVPPHLLTLLASESTDIEDPNNADEIARLAKALLRVLVSGNEQPTLPLKNKKKTA
jgi:transcriptional regulator with XRE-family HTH domain